MISLIVATVNRVTELDRLLGSLDGQTYRDFEVIVIDQNSDDRLAPVLNGHSGLAIRHLRSERGLSRARNVGLRVASGELLAIPDDDCWYPRDLLASVAEWFAAHPTFGLLSTKTRTAENQPSGPNSPATARACTKWNVWSCAVSTAMFMRQSVSQAVGDFNEDIGVGASSEYQSGEETDYVLRALERGFAMWYEPSLTVHHPELQSIARLRKTTYPFALGTGLVLRMHSYPLHRVGSQLMRSLGGAVVSLCRGDLARAHVYALRGTGQLVGYIAGPRGLRSALVARQISAAPNGPSLASLFSEEHRLPMNIPFRGLFRNIFHLGSGELVGRLANIATVVWLGHRYGVVVLGVYALAQSVTQYLQPMIDFGLRHVGARLLSLYPQAARAIVDRVQRRRLFTAGLVLPLVFAYSACAKLPLEMKIFLFAFSAAGALYAVSLDWAAWGQEKLHLVGLAKSAVPLSILASVLIGGPSGTRVLWYAVAGNGFGFLLQGAFSWAWWRRQPSPPILPGDLKAVRESLVWRRTSVMGLAWLCYLAFNTIDVLMLGLMSNPQQVGLYSAAYRVLNQVLATYYLLTQVLYPRFARHEIGDRARMLQARILGPLVGTGILIAALLSLARRPVLTVLFGHQFLAAGPLLILLAWSVPLDFLTSYLSNAFLAWGMERKILLSTGIGAASNIVLNLALIPSFGARGAAVNTILSYAIFLTALYFSGRSAKELAPQAASGIDAVACG